MIGHHSLLEVDLLGTAAGLSVTASATSPSLLEPAAGFKAAEWTAGALEMLSIAAASSPVAAILFVFERSFVM